MRMILVHGINQEGKSSETIKTDWLDSLQTTCNTLGITPLSRLSGVDAPFYGDTLDELSEGWTSSDAIALGTDDSTDDFDEFAVDALRDMALVIGVTEEQINEEMNEAVVPLGSGPHKKWPKAIARAIERISPFHGTIALRVLGQAHAYIRNQHVHDRVNDIVRPCFDDDEPMVVVAHSLGTIVAYSILREFARNDRPRESPLFLTLGSPLGIDSIRKGFPKPRIKPENVTRWVNGADPEDFVALRPELTTGNFGPGIENYSDIENGSENPHSIRMYLSDPRMAKIIDEVIP